MWWMERRRQGGGSEVRARMVGFAEMLPINSMFWGCAGAGRGVASRGCGAAGKRGAATYRPVPPTPPLPPRVSISVWKGETGVGGEVGGADGVGAMCVCGERYHQGIVGRVLYV